MQPAWCSRGRFRMMSWAADHGGRRRDAEDKGSEVFDRDRGPPPQAQSRDALACTSPSEGHDGHRNGYHTMIYPATQPAPALDRFGRIVEQRWRDHTANANRVQHAHAYDRASNRLYREVSRT